jgi:hypothetical protein
MEQWQNISNGLF